ncbi:MAG: hypothetical protein ACNFW9_05065 [Candidatus Kerfeldbacteria bacterium]
MGSFTDFLRKIGILKEGKDDYQTDEFDNQSDMKKDDNTETPNENQEPRQ